VTDARPADATAADGAAAPAARRDPAARITTLTQLRAREMVRDQTRPDADERRLLAASEEEELH
jgi:hypothetical protein